jgi:hypothetical protein
MCIYRELACTHRSIRATAPELPEHAARAIQKAMAKKPSERFGTASEFVTALEGLRVRHFK